MGNSKLAYLRVTGWLHAINCNVSVKSIIKSYCQQINSWQFPAPAFRYTQKMGLSFTHDLIIFAANWELVVISQVSSVNNYCR